MGKKIIALATAVMAVSALGKTTTNMVVAAVLLFCNFSVIAEAQLHDGGARNIHYAADANTPPGIGLPELQNIATILTSSRVRVPVQRSGGLYLHSAIDQGPIRTNSAPQGLP